MSENIKPEIKKPLRLTTRGKAAAIGMGVLSIVGAKDTGQGILNYIHTRNEPHYEHVDATVGQDGNSIWEIARKSQPEGDISPLVDRITAEHGGTPIVQPGEHLVIDHGHLVNPDPRHSK